MSPSGLLEWDLDDLKRAMRLSGDDVKTHFRDGRRVSFLLERRLKREVFHGALAPSEGASYDLEDSCGRLWEVRSISSRGTYFCPSYMVGSGRKFQREPFLHKLDSIHGYVLSDIEMFPRIPYWCVEATRVRWWWDREQLGTTTKVTRRRALELLEGLR